MEYGRVWHPHWYRVGHVNFMLFVFCFLALDTQCESGLWWNIGFRFYHLDFRIWIQRFELRDLDSIVIVRGRYIVHQIFFFT